MRPLPLLLSALFLALPAAAGNPYEGSDDDAQVRFRRLLSPLEVSISYLAFARELQGDPVADAVPAADQQAAMTAMTQGAQALSGTAPDAATAQQRAADARASLIHPLLTNYRRMSDEASRGDAALTVFETRLFSRLREQWGDPPADGAAAPAPRHVRALLRAEAANYIGNPPSAENPVDRAAAVSSIRANLQAAVTGAEGEALNGLYTAAGMARQPAGAASADPRMANVNDRAAMLRRVMPSPGFSDLERTILATVLTEAALADVAAGRSTLDLHREALDAANLAMADQSSPEVQAAIRAKTLFRPGSLETLRSSIPAADMSRYVCGAMQAAQQRAPALVGGSGTAQGDLQRSAQEAGVAPGAATALPGVARYCEGTAALRAGPSSPDTRPVQPEQRMGRTTPPPGPGTAGQNVTGRPVDGGGAGGGLLGGLWNGLKANAPFMAGGALGGLLVAAALGAGPVGLLGGLALGAAFGGILGMLGGGKGDG